MKKDVNRLIREVTIYTLRSWHRRVLEQRSYKEYYAGFWCKGMKTERENFYNFINVARELALCGATYIPDGEIAVGEVNFEKTYHSDRKDWYVNVSIEMSSTNPPRIEALTYKMFDNTKKDDTMKPCQQTKRRKHK